MAERSSKRRKLVQRGEDGYVPGNIVEIELRNFMTFEFLKVKPGPRLNLVIGPNGSGKSSLVCAIALGLAGEPQILGRAVSIGAYVKRGEDSGSINIALRGDRADEEIRITRKIDVRNKSEWLLNGKPVSKRDIIEIIQRFNIQVNNLTQFLPQDRVCEFAKLTPIQLLEETEKAVGDPDLPAQHNALVDKSCELKRLEVTVKQNSDILIREKVLNAEQEKDVERFRLREQLMQKAKLMEKKVPWLKYDVKKVEYMQAKENEKKAREKLDEAACLLNDLNAPIEEKKQEKLVQEEACKKISNLIAQNNMKFVEILQNERHLGVQVQSKYDEMEDLRRQEESRQDRILRAKEDLAAAELELAEWPLCETPKDKLEILRGQILELECSARQKKSQKKEKENLLAQKKESLTHCNYRLKEMENRNIKLLHALKNSGSEKVVEAYNWLKTHRGELRKEAYGPVLLEVNVPEQRHAAYLENHVAYYLWKSFITQDRDDHDFLAKNLLPLDIPVLNYVATEKNKRKTFEISEKMHEVGVYSRLDQVFDAPAVVKEVLIDQVHLDESYVGSRETDQKADKAPQLGISDLWTPDNHYRWTESRYNGHISASAQQVTPSRLLLCGSDAGETERLKLKKKELEESITVLDESLKALVSEQRQLEDEAAELHRQREKIVDDVKDNKKKRRHLENRVDQRRRKLESLEKENDPEANTQKLIDQAAKLNKQRFQFAMKVKDLLIEAVSFKRSFAEKNMRCIEIDAKIKTMKQHVKDKEDAATTASMYLNQCKRETDKCREALSSAKSLAESIAVITPELSQAFIEMPSTLEDLEAAIQDVTTQANSIAFLNNDVVEQYERRQQKIKSISIKLEADEKEMRQCLSEIDVLKEKWLPTLRKLVLKINETFSRNFCEMAVAGEVSLDEHEMDFDKFGILIRVKFREAGQLQVLSAHHQSGGERSVSTILYLVSLQDLTNCPFRVVDEINQGMDPVNERKMFQQLVRAASQPNTPQCFLLTPKLLPNLDYSNECSVLNIITGPWIGKPSELWSAGDSYRAVVGHMKILNPQEDT